MEYIKSTQTNVQENFKFMWETNSYNQKRITESTNPCKKNIKELSLIQNVNDEQINNSVGKKALLLKDNKEKQCRTIEGQQI